MKSIQYYGLCGLRWLWLCLLGNLCWLAGAAAQTAGAAPESRDFPFAQLKFDTISGAETNAGGSITALAQDARDFIWIGTQQGVIRYDGYRFRRFVYAPNDAASISGDYIYALHAAPDGKIWIGTNSDGLSVFDPASERFSGYRHDPKRAGSISAGRISALALDARGGVWVGADNGLDYLAPGARDFIHYRHDPARPDSLLDDKVRSLLFDQSGRLWVGSVSGLQRLSPDLKGFELIAGAAPENKDGTAIDVETLFQAQDGKLWLGTLKHGAAWLQTTAEGAPQLHWLPRDGAPASGAGGLRLTHPWVSGIAQIQDEIWLATRGGGINVAAASDGRILRQLRHDLALPGSLALDSVKPLLLDRSGLLWLGTWGEGLQRFNTKNKMVRLLRHSPAIPEGFSHPDVRSILELADGRFLFGSFGNGIDIVDRQRGLVGGWRPRNRHADGLPEAEVFALTQTRDGAIWAGMRTVGVVRKAPDSDQWQNIPGAPGPLVQKFHQGRDGSLWLAGSQGVGRWREGEARIQRLNDEQGKAMHSRVSAFAEDREGRIWIGSSSGLWLVEPGAQTMRVFHPEAGRADSLLSNYVYGLLVDSKNLLWVSTDKGLQRLQGWQGKSPRFENISERLGSVGVIFGANLLEDKEGRIWTEGTVIEPKQMRMTQYFKADGMDIGTIWNASYAQSRDGLLFFGGTKGVGVVNPAMFRRWDYVPPLVVTELKINSLASPLQELAEAGRSSRPVNLILTPEQRNFSIGFAVLDFTEPEKNRYQYRLDGYDKNWIDTDSEHRSAEYGNLWPGQYTLYVRGSNRMGDWSPHELAITIQVLPRWYQSWWFVCLAALLLMGGVAALVQFRTRYLRLRQQELAAQVQERTRDLKNANQELQDANQSLKQAQAKIVQQEKLAALGSLVAGVAHELNTPLGNCLMVASSLENATDTIAQDVEAGRLRRSCLDAYFENAKASTELLVRNLSTAANLITSFKQISVNQTPEQRCRFNLAHTLEELVHTFAKQLRNAHCTVQLEVAQQIELDSFPMALSQVILNLLDNTVTHAFSGQQCGQIVITVQELEDNQLKISFSDNGCGIAPENLAHIFEPFFTTRMGQGSYGLGLSIGYNIVTGVLGGSLTAHSTPGQGSVFEIILPACAAEKQ